MQAHAHTQYSPLRGNHLGPHLLIISFSSANRVDFLWRKSSLLFLLSYTNDVEKNQISDELNAKLNKRFCTV